MFCVKCFFCFFLSLLLRIDFGDDIFSCVLTSFIALSLPKRQFKSIFGNIASQISSNPLKSKIVHFLFTIFLQTVSIYFLSAHNLCYVACFQCCTNPPNMEAAMRAPVEAGISNSTTSIDT